MYMDDIKRFAKNEKELETLIQALRIYSKDIGTKFRIEKYAILIIRSEKRQMRAGIELANQEKIRIHGEKETYKYWEIVEADTIKQAEMEKKSKKSMSGEQGNHSKQNLLQNPHRRDQQPSCSPCMIL